MTNLTKKPSDIGFDAFMETYGGIYEHSPWIAESAWQAKSGTSIDSVDGLHAAMKQAVNDADRTAKLALVCAHPDLAGKAAQRGTLTEDSKSEQSGAGLDQCSADEFAEFQSLNGAYKEKFGFPFIIAVKGLDRTAILAAFRARLAHDRETEFETAITQIHRIALLRLSNLG